MLKSPASARSYRLDEPADVGLDFLFQALASVVPQMESRTTVRQLFAFLAVARAEATGNTILLNDIRLIEDPATGQSIVGQSIRQTFAMLLVASEREPRGLGWVTQETDPDDKRRKFLKLTEEGCAVAAAMLGQTNTAMPSIGLCPSPLTVHLR
ncbi:MAG: hypothetical protein ACXWVS_00985 [Hyphomicrobium sp.]